MSYALNLKNVITDTVVYLIEEKGFTTTLDVKEYLIDTYPTFFWVQSQISEVLREWEANSDVYTFDDNGTYRTYRKVDDQDTPLDVEIDTRILEFNKGLLTIKGTKREVIETASQYGINLHYSETKQEFCEIKSMHPNHMMNAIKLEVDACKTPEELFEVLDSGLVSFFMEQQCV